MRLNKYASDHPAMLKDVIELINKELFHILKQQALSGHAVIRSTNPLLESRTAKGMILDVLSERGFTVVSEGVGGASSNALQMHHYNITIAALVPVPVFVHVCGCTFLLCCVHLGAPICRRSALL